MTAQVVILSASQVTNFLLLCEPNSRWRKKLSPTKETDSGNWKVELFQLLLIIVSLPIVVPVYENYIG